MKITINHSILCYSISLTKTSKGFDNKSPQRTFYRLFPISSGNLLDFKAFNKIFLRSSSPSMLLDHEVPNESTEIEFNENFFNNNKI